PHPLYSPEFEQVIALCAVCFLPRHIYMSAMNSNGTISYRFVACTIDLLLLALDQKLAWVSLTPASASMTVALFTKYTTYAILPATALCCRLTKTRGMENDDPCSLWRFVLLCGCAHCAHRLCAPSLNPLPHF